MRVVFLCLLALVAVNATNKLENFKHKVLAASTDATESGDDFTTPLGCVQKGGKCEKVAGCTGTGVSIVRGLCPGDSSISCCVRPGTPPPPPPTGLAGLLALSENTAYSAGCTRFNWAERGLAPRQYIKGMMYSFAKAVCEPTRADVVFMGKTETGKNDALAWYADKLRPVFGNPAAGLTTVRQLYALMIGLGMRESSGVYCTGRDMSADFSKPETAEAGLFQTSWGASRNSALLPPMYAKYAASKAGCGVSVYTPGLTCNAKNLQSWGPEGDIGFKWQVLTKQCPSFATEYAGVLLRVNGGEKGEWGPLRKKAAQVNKTCYDLLGAVQLYVQNNPKVCDEIKA